MVELESKFLYWWSDMRASATEATIVMLCRAAFHAGYHAAQQNMHWTGLTPLAKKEVEEIVMRALSTGSV